MKNLISSILVLFLVISITLADYGVVFEKGKPDSNIAKTIEINFVGEYERE